MTQFQVFFYFSNSHGWVHFIEYTAVSIMVWGVFEARKKICKEP